MSGLESPALEPSGPESWSLTLADGAGGQRDSGTVCLWLLHSLSSSPVILSGRAAVAAHVQRRRAIQGQEWWQDLNLGLCIAPHRPPQTMHAQCYTFIVGRAIL